MFGYVRYDFPNLHVKDVMLYKALYCGLCKGIAASSGQIARVGLTYDVTFLSALLHNIMGVEVEIVRETCAEHLIRKQPMAKVDALTRELGALNTVLAYYKLTDDIEDGAGGRGKRLCFRKGFLRAKEEYPVLVRLVEKYLSEQAAAERKKEPSPDIAAEPSASMMAALSEHFLRDMGTPDTIGLFYQLGKWVYLIDALDDYDADKKRGGYNPFVLTYGAETREALMAQSGADVSFLFDTMFYAMREHLAGIRFHFNRDLTDNVILRGIPIETMRVMKGEPRPPMTVRI